MRYGLYICRNYLSVCPIITSSTVWIADSIFLPPILVSRSLLNNNNTTLFRLDRHLHSRSSYSNFVVMENLSMSHTNVWESMGKPCSCRQFIKSRLFYYKPRENPYQVLQVTHTSYSERAMKSKVRMIKSVYHSTKLYRKKILLVCCRWHCYSCCHS